MRAIGLGAVLGVVVSGLGACSAEQLGGGRRDAAGTPGVDGAGLITDASVGPIFATDASTAPVYSDACWVGSLPPQPLPILPTSMVVEACAAGTGTPAWSYPQDPAGNSADDRHYIVGRWSTCNAGLSFLPAHSVIEFGANGRWRLLAFDSRGNTLSTGLIPVAGSGTSGYYYLLGTGQLDLNADESPGGSRILSVSFTAGMGTLRFTDNQGSPPVYVRTTPSRLNGADNPPPTVAGGCSMVGTWDVPANNGPVPAPASTFSFDSAGNFVAGAAGADLCDGHTLYGTYALSAGMFQLTSNVGFGVCAWWYTGGWTADFDASCDHLSLTREYDNCKGGRGYFNEPTTLTRRTVASADAGTASTPGLPVE
jgi:hypothetical protein